MESQRSRNESQHDRPNTTVDDGSSYDDRQERKTLVKTLEEYTQERATDREDDLVLIQVPRSKWEKEESEEEERDGGVIKVQPDALTTFLPSPSVSVTAETTTNRETEEKRERSVEMERGRDREREKTPILSTSHTSVAPSTGKDRSDSALCTDRDGEKRMEMERWSDRDRGRERDRQKESKRSKEQTKEEEKGKDRGHSSVASAQKRNPTSSSSSHSYSYSMSHDTERRDNSSKSSSCPSRKSSGGRSRESRATEVPDQNTHKSCRDTFLDHHQDPSGNCRPAGTHHSLPSLSHSQGKDRDSLPSGSDLGKSRMSSPAAEVMQDRSRNESKAEKEEWKLRQLIKENEEMVAETEGGSQWEGRRELEEGERPSSRSNSVSSSASQEDDGRKEEKKKKQKKHKKEKRRGAPELLEEGELKRHKHKKKTSKKSRDGREEKSSGQVDDHPMLCSVMLS